MVLKSYIVSRSCAYLHSLAVVVVEVVRARSSQHSLAGHRPVVARSSASGRIQILALWFPLEVWSLVVGEPRRLIEIACSEATELAAYY